MSLYTDHIRRMLLKLDVSYGKDTAPTVELSKDEYREVGDTIPKERVVAMLTGHGIVKKELGP